MVDRIGRRGATRTYIREWIKARGLDQKRTAERMECEPGTVSKLLNGRMELTVSWLTGFADALDVSVPDLFRHPDAAGQAQEIEARLQLLPQADRDELMEEFFFRVNRVVEKRRAGGG